MARAAVQPRTRVAVVGELGDHLVALGCSTLSQRGKLGADRAAVVLALGGDPGVDGDVHGFASLAITRPPVAVRMNWYPAASASTRGSACGVHAGRRAPCSVAVKVGAAVGWLMSPASPHRPKRAAAPPSSGGPASTAARKLS